MAGRPSRCSCALTGIAIGVGEIEETLRDGWQPSDTHVIYSACEAIKAELIEAEDVEMDVAAIRRIATVGRHRLYDERFMARERSLQRTRLAQEKKSPQRAAHSLKARIEAA